jgi:large subunit ribosomal protein L4
MSKDQTPMPVEESKAEAKPTEFGELQSVAIKSQVMREVILALQANLHHSNANTKRRGEVRGGGKKPWRQKGTGRARVGSSRTPVWRGGGIVFGPLKTKNYQQNITPVLRRQALLGTLSLKAKANRISTLVLDPTTAKTKVAVKQLASNPSITSGLAVVNDVNLSRVIRNIAGIEVVHVNRLNALAVASARNIIFVNDSWAILKTRLGI